MGDYGASVSQKGYDVKTCADRFLVYSSAFQTLKIFNTYSVSTTIPASGTNTITITHNLGYLAPFLIVYNGSTTIGTGTSYFFSDSDGYGIEGFCTNFINTLTIDIPDYYDSGNSNTGDTVYFTVYLFLDGFDTVAEQNINTGLTSGASSTDYGFRISKAGYDVKTCADIDCIISSSTPTNIIHKKGIEPTTNVTHNLGYVPAFLDFIDDGTGGIQLNTTAYAYTTEIALGSTNTKYIIFKQKNV